MTRPPKNPGASGIRTRDLPLSIRTPWPLGERGGYIRGFPTRMVYLYYISCLTYTILVGNPRNIINKQTNQPGIPPRWHTAALR